jgi:predicted membrane channel-forming protein YqfA (hemolysin III family)
MDNEDKFNNEVLYSLALTMSIICQERDPWNITYTLIPIVIFFTVYLLNRIFRRKGTKFNRKMLRKGLFFYFCAMPFFYFALDEYTDYLRIAHGVWHLVVSVGAFYFWQLKEKEGTEATYFDVIMGRHIFEIEYKEIHNP